MMSWERGYGQCFMRDNLSVVAGQHGGMGGWLTSVTAAETEPGGRAALQALAALAGFAISKMKGRADDVVNGEAKLDLRKWRC